MKREPKGRLIYSASETDADILTIRRVLPAAPEAPMDYERLAKLMRTRTVVDGRNIVPPGVVEHGFVLRAIGKGQY